MNDNAVEKVRASIEQLPEQCEEAWQEARRIEFPPEYKRVDHVVVCGMGGSGLPTHFITSAFATTVPVVLVNGYDLPYWVSQRSLVYLSSYSGGTEETLSCATEAKRQKAKITGSTSGGKLAEFFKREEIPAYIFVPKHNPSGQPRLGLGYGIFGQLGIFEKLGFVVNVGPSLDSAIPGASTALKRQKAEIAKAAGSLANRLKGKQIFIFAADHLVGNAHIFANQLNETAKNLANYFSIPEANHHLLEGLKNPKKKEIACVFLDSRYYSKKIARRIELTEEVVRKNGATATRYEPTLSHLVGEALEILYLSSMLSFELSQLYGEDPIAIPWVDWFKEQLAKK